MVNNTQKDNLYLAGGIMYIQPYAKDGSLSEEKYDMGATEVTLTRDTQSATAFTRSGGLKQKIAEVVTEENYTMKITCNSFSPSNLANALGSSIEVVSFSENEILPSGEISDGEYKYVRIKAGTNPLLKAKLIFVGSPVAGKRVIAIIHEANIKMGGDLPLMSEDFASMSFEGSANKTEEGYYTHFIEQEAKRFLPTELSASVNTLSLLLGKKETIAINTNASDYSYKIESETQDFITLKKMDTNLEVTSKKVGSGTIKIKAKGKDMKESELSIEVVVQEMPITELDASNESVSLNEDASESIDISTNATGEDMQENPLEIDCAITEKPTTELSTTPESLNITLSQTETLQVNTNATDFTYELQELSEADCITILKQDSSLQVSGAKVGTGKIVLRATKEGMKEVIKEVQVAVNNT